MRTSDQYGPVELTWQHVASWRAQRHHLDARVPRAETLALVAEQGGLHAQVMSSAELSLWARVDELEAGGVAAALWDDRTLVKTWAMRATLHLLPASEYGLWQAAIGRFSHYLAPAWLRAFGVTAEELETLLAAVAEAVRGQVLSRSQLAAAVTKETGSAELGDKLLNSWGALLKPAAFRGLLCFGPGEGQTVGFTSPETWLPAPGPRVDPEEAALVVTRRYLATYGPATRDDYSHWWGGTTPAKAGRLIAALGDEVVTVTVEGEPAFVLREHAAGLGAVEPVASVRLLPAFDQYVIEASSRRGHLLAGPFRDRVYRPQGWLSPVLVVDGVICGVWKSARKAKRVVVEIEPLVPIGAPVRAAAEDEAERLAAFLGGALDLSWRA